MKDLILYADARLGESSTWASIAVALTALHLNIEPGLMAQFATWGIGLSVGLGVLMKETGTKSAMGVASDALAAAAGSISTKAVTLALLAGLLCVGLVACGSQAPATTVAEAEVGLTVAERGAFQYAKLPACPAVALCSDPAIVVKIKAADNVAFAAVRVAAKSAAGSDIAAAMSAIASLSALLPATVN